eukprot:COSAG06_NODE_55_length_27705_cov_7.023402_10_plen_221_part_00
MSVALPPLARTPGLSRRTPKPLRWAMPGAGRPSPVEPSRHSSRCFNARPSHSRLTPVVGASLFEQGADILRSAAKQDKKSCSPQVQHPTPQVQHPAPQVQHPALAMGEDATLEALMSTGRDLDLLFDNIGNGDIGRGPRINHFPTHFALVVPNPHSVQKAQSSTGACIAHNRELLRKLPAAVVATSGVLRKNDKLFLDVKKLRCLSGATWQDAADFPQLA